MFRIKVHIMSICLHHQLTTYRRQVETATQQCVRVSEGNSSWILGNFTNKTERLIYPLLLLLFSFMQSCSCPVNTFPGNCFYSLRTVFCGGPCPDPYFSLFSSHSGIFGDTAGLQSGPHSISFINFSYQFNVTLMSHWAAGNCTAGLIHDRTGRTQEWIVKGEMVSSVNNTEAVCDVHIHLWLGKAKIENI